MKSVNAALHLILEEVPRIEHWLFDAGPLEHAALGLRLMALMPFTSKKETGGKPGGLVAPPFFSRLGEIITAQKGGFLSPKTWAAAIPKLAQEHPEGTVLLLYGLSLHNGGRLQKAEETLDRAAKAPALLPVRKAALISLASTQTTLVEGAKGEE